MRIKRNNGDDTPILNISSLLDVMFILLIFFLATSTLAREEHDLKVNLPVHKQTGSLSAASKTMVINVRKNGYYYMQNSVKTLEQVQACLLDAVAQNENQRVLIRGDREALHGHVAAAVGACRDAGIREANIGYQDRIDS